MIDAEEDSIFTLKNAAIVFDSLTDKAYAKTSAHVHDSVYIRKDTIQINKELHFENVFFYRVSGSFDNTETFYYIVFNKEVRLKNSFAFFESCTFNQAVRVEFDQGLEEVYHSYLGRVWYLSITFTKCVFNKGHLLRTSYDRNQNDIIPAQFIIMESTIYPIDQSLSQNAYWVGSLLNFWVSNCDFEGDGQVRILAPGGSMFELDGNDFGKNRLDMVIGSDLPFQTLIMEGNTINHPVRLRLSEIKQENSIAWPQLSAGLISHSPYYDYLRSLGALSREQLDHLGNIDSVMTNYLEEYRHQNTQAFKEETKLLGKLHALYKSQHDTEFANAAFLELKDLETQRLGYLYQQDQSFRTYFKWKVNQFLRLFSDYGTEPSKAIVFAVYVIAFFALIYLFFPNHWDSHGRMRIMDRLRFFLKYSKQQEGAKEVYLEEKNEELVPFEEFKSYFKEHGKKAPGFFYGVAMPLYKWSVSGTRLVSALLGKVDVLKGTWEDTPKSQRWLKSSLVIGAFIIALLYDLFIKVLNAVMLSINTFTTLGFGEIPIKGLPRYLAIIQGFIGWFMLTIFSVSLISQLLN